MNVDRRGHTKGGGGGGGDLGVSPPTKVPHSEKGCKMYTLPSMLFIDHVGLAHICRWHIPLPTATLPTATLPTATLLACSLPQQPVEIQYNDVNTEKSKSKFLYETSLIYTPFTSSYLIQHITFIFLPHLLPLP